MKKRRILVKLVLGSLMISAIWGLVSLFTASNDEEELLFDRLWVTDFPEDEREFGHDFFVVRGQDFGFFSRSSMFRFEEELFEFELNNGSLELHFPQTGQTSTVPFEISDCNDLPPYDLCLDLEHNPWGGPRRYYSIQNDGDDEGRARLQQLLHRRQLRRR